MNYLDLFSGIGGFALGAYWAGWRFQRHYFSEIDPWCCRLYQQRFPYAVPLGDIREIDGKALVADSAERHAGGGTGEQQGKESTDREPSFVLPDASRGGRETEAGRGDWLITGGFPCQDISVAGKGAGIEGLRSGLWFEYARLIGEIRPRYAIMENVGALTRRGLDRVLGSLAEIGYDAQWSDIRASDVGAPHRRERIWIVAYPRQHIKRTGQRVHGNKTQRCETSTYIADGSFWATESGIRRVAHGVPQRMDRLRGLGNAIVPQIAELIFAALQTSESEKEKHDE